MSLLVLDCDFDRQEFYLSLLVPACDFARWGFYLSLFSPAGKTPLGGGFICLCSFSLMISLGGGLICLCFPLPAKLARRSLFAALRGFACLSARRSFPCGAVKFRRAARFRSLKDSGEFKRQALVAQFGFIVFRRLPLFCSAAVVFPLGKNSFACIIVFGRPAV